MMVDGKLWRTGKSEEIIEKLVEDVNGTQEEFYMIEKPCLICRGNK